MRGTSLDVIGKCSKTSQAGPFDQWPTGMGFEYFYGFMGGDSSQWTPMLYRNTTLIAPFVGRPRAARPRPLSEGFGKQTEAERDLSHSSLQIATMR